MHILWTYWTSCEHRADNTTPQPHHMLHATTTPHHMPNLFRKSRQNWRRCHINLSLCWQGHVPYRGVRTTNTMQHLRARPSPRCNPWPQCGAWFCKSTRLTRPQDEGRGQHFDGGWQSASWAGMLSKKSLRINTRINTMKIIDTMCCFENTKTLQTCCG